MQEKAQTSLALSFGMHWVAISLPGSAINSNESLQAHCTFDAAVPVLVDIT